MRDKVEALSESNAVLLAVDPHEQWSAKYMLRGAGFTTDDLRFPLLMDPSLTVSAAYGVAFPMRVHVERSNRPATFVIDRNGILRYAKLARSFGDRPKPDDIVRFIQGLR